ncbi:HD domain-containing protein [Psychroflexus montanilacus]|uniref:HD domain-containing protein n=1 Tax=Psychroflexus montanilacus TaxID=2873598 RepID=UPI001CD0262C|nr:HD domain-containing protein [Psychroflexus montanilacus]MBZ9652708.1 HD domain-containing protein [Psychroflexus montanilacus]
MTQTQIISNTKFFVQETLKHAEGGHDWFHILRVYNNARNILSNETADSFVVELASLLHDIADSKFHNGDEEIGPQKAKAFLKTQSVDSKVVNHVVNIIKNVSYKGGHSSSDFHSIELDIVQDADRLDAIGAIGIARTFNFGGFKNNPIYDPEVQPNPIQSKEEYKKSNSPTINHFYEKLLLLKDKMNTKTAKKIAAQRHEFMEDYLEQFYKEWNGKL